MIVFTATAGFLTVLAAVVCPLFCGLWHPSSSHRQAKVDSIMQLFEQEEAEEAAKRKAMIDNPEDDDGFVTVTYKRKRGRNSNNASERGGTPDGRAGAKRKRKGAGELTDFYRFQVGQLGGVVAA